MSSFIQEGSSENSRFLVLLRSWGVRAREVPGATLWVILRTIAVWQWNRPQEESGNDAWPPSRVTVWGFLYGAGPGSGDLNVAFSSETPFRQPAVSAAEFFLLDKVICFILQGQAGEQPQELGH